MVSVYPGMMSIEPEIWEGAISVSTEFETFANTVITEWPDCAWSRQLEAAIEDLYRSQLQFPPSWTQDRREDFITSHADADAIELTATFDDLVDIVIDRYGREYGVLPHSEDAAELIDAERRAALSELEQRLRIDLPEDIAEATVHSLGRADGSMAACGPTHRHLKSTPHARIRRRRTGR